MDRRFQASAARFAAVVQALVSQASRGLRGHRNRVRGASTTPLPAQPGHGGGGRCQRRDRRCSGVLASALFAAAGMGNAGLGRLAVPAMPIPQEALPRNGQNRSRKAGFAANPSGALSAPVPPGRRGIGAGRHFRGNRLGRRGPQRKQDLCGRCDEYQREADHGEESKRDSHCQEGSVREERRRERPPPPPGA